MRVSPLSGQIAARVEVRDVSDCKRSSSQRRIVSGTYQTNITIRAERYQIVATNFLQRLIKPLTFGRFKTRAFMDNYTLR